MCTHMSMVCVCTSLTTHKLLSCNDCVSQRFITCCVTALHVGLPTMSKVGTYIKVSTPRFGRAVSVANKGCDAGKIWCAHLASQLMKETVKKSASVTHRDVALVGAADAAGCDCICQIKVTVDLPTRSLPEI